MASFEVIKPTSKNDKSYCDLVARWWNWVYAPDRDATHRDANSDDVTFLRGDVVGNPRLLRAGIDTTPRALVPCFCDRVRINKGSKLFFPVYDSHFVLEDPFGDTDIKPCGTSDRCLEAAKNDFEYLYESWATYYVDKSEPADVTDLQAHYIETPEFTTIVKENNQLNREIGFSLTSGEFKGRSVGYFVLMTKIQEGIYTLDFGGRATNYFTRSVYNIIV